MIYQMPTMSGTRFTIQEILVAVGDPVTVGQTLVTLETDKAIVELPATHTGTISKLLVQPGDRIACRQALLELDGPTNDRR